MNKIELIREIVTLWRERLFDNDEAIVKIEKVLSRDIEEEELPKIVEYISSRGRNSGIGMVFENKVRKAGKWNRFSEREKRYIKDNYATMTSREIGNKLGRTEGSIQQFLFKSKKTRKKDFKDKELEFIKRELEIGTPRRVIANALKISLPNLKHKIRKIRGFRN